MRLHAVEVAETNYRRASIERRSKCACTT